MKQKERLEKAAAKYGGTVEWHERGFNVDTPRGFLWSSAGTCTLSHGFENAGGQRWLREEVTEAIERMADGVEPAPPGYEGWWAE